jgi:antitoxin MazE
MTTKTRIVRIGNSRGIRVPKLLLDHADLPEEVELRAEPGRLIVSGTARLRAGWEAKARTMHGRADDALLDRTPRTRFDTAEWHRW